MPRAIESSSEFHAPLAASAKSHFLRAVINYFVALHYTPTFHSKIIALNHVEDEMQNYNKQWDEPHIYKKRQTSERLPFAAALSLSLSPERENSTRVILIITVWRWNSRASYHPCSVEAERRKEDENSCTQSPRKDNDSLWPRIKSHAKQNNFWIQLMPSRSSTHISI